MNRVQKAIFPGMAAGCMFLIFITSLIVNPQIALASTPPPAATALPVENASPVDVSQENQPEQVLAAAEEPAPEAQAQEEPAGEMSCLVSSSFPDSILRWCDWIGKYANENGLDPNLIASVMLQESAGNPDAYSKSGAVGLMQVMPRDGLAASFNCINGPCFASRPSMQELYDPEFNISYGTRMLAGLVNRHGSIREALRAYGPMNMGYYYADLVLGILQRYQ